MADSMASMKSTIRRFLSLITSLSAEKNVDLLLDRVSHETMQASEAQAAIIYLLNDEETELIPQNPQFANDRTIDRNTLASIPLDQAASDNPLLEVFLENTITTFPLSRDNKSHVLAAFFQVMDSDQLTLIAVPLHDREQHTTGLLCLAFSGSLSSRAVSPERIGFTRALSGFASVTMQSQQLLKSQQALLESFIQLIAGAIDEKSPYTGGHCQRVPELTKMLATAACEAQEGLFKDFSLSDEQWGELRISAWLHDCGKVTTPEYVVDKSTKLETIYDRIHKVRMRFKVLKRDAEIQFWQALANGGNREQLQKTLNQELQQLDDDFAFIADCNVGGEFMAEDKQQRLTELAGHCWT